MLRSQLLTRYSGVPFSVAFPPRDLLEHYPLPVSGALEPGDDVAYFVPVYAAAFGGKFTPPVAHYLLTFARVVGVKEGKAVTVRLRTVDGAEVRKRLSALTRLVCFRAAREGEQVPSYGERVARGLVHGDMAA